MAAVTLDDRHTQITYDNGLWSQSPLVTSRRSIYNNTLTWTNSSGATAAVNFYGSLITIYGILTQFPDPTFIPTRDPRPNTTIDLSFTLDGSTVLTTTQFNQQPEAQFNVVLYNSSVLPYAQHQLVIRNDSPGDVGLLCLDAVHVGDRDFRAEEQLIKRKLGLRVATGVLGGLLGLTLILCMFISYRLWRLRSKASSPSAQYLKHAQKKST
ncbi:hypothetical protein EST38_g7175 [Candolleomyces aberdarensis]|uniref:Uncharacterized protein n=1 Tax=Candolleomyces aberdarensis TaxID=2316362 RepID=A0A4V1Q3I2_9AGAR|nr:hypothetical protein EST38_g7175 [Candolleomyces aberdarensis]